MKNARDDLGKQFTDVKVNFIRYGRGSKSNVTYAYIEGICDDEPVNFITYNQTAIDFVEQFVAASPGAGEDGYASLAALKTGNWIGYRVDDVDLRLDFMDAVPRQNGDLELLNFKNFDVVAEYRDEVSKARKAYLDALRKAYGAAPSLDQDAQMDEAVNDMANDDLRAGDEDLKGPADPDLGEPAEEKSENKEADASSEAEAAPAEEKEATQQPEAEKESSEAEASSDADPAAEKAAEEVPAQAASKTTTPVRRSLIKKDKIAQAYGNEDVKAEERQEKDVDLESVKQKEEAEKKPEPEAEKPAAAAKPATPARKIAVKPRVTPRVSVGMKR